MQAALFTMTGGEQVDLSWLAPHQPSYECLGKAAIITGVDGAMEILYPCGFILPADCFRPRVRFGASYGAPQRRRPVMMRCVECEEKIRTAKNRLNFWGNRMENSAKHHYRKERKEGLHAAPTFNDYLLLTNLDLKELAKRAREAAEQDLRCTHCHKQWSAFPGGAIMHLSLDRRDPTRLLAMDNYGFTCRTGNSQYARVSPRARTVRDAMYRWKQEHGYL